MITVRAATAADEARWRELWAGYNAFYEAHVPESITQATWRRILDPTVPILGRVAEADGRLVGFSNSVLHESTWAAAPICYLEDLFVDPAVRGTGVGRRLLEDLVELARQRGWPTLYWHTRGNNATARRLYDTFTPADDFVRYVVTPTDRQRVMKLSARNTLSGVLTTATATSISETDKTDNHPGRP